MRASSAKRIREIDQQIEALQNEKKACIKDLHNGKFLVVKTTGLSNSFLNVMRRKSVWNFLSRRAKVSHVLSVTNMTTEACLATNGIDN